MAKRQELTCVSFLRLPDGSLAEWSALPPEVKQDARERIVENVNKALGNYFTAHPEEIEPFSHCKGVSVHPA